MELDELRRRLKTELDALPAPPPAGDRIARTARQRVWRRRVITCVVAVAVVAGGGVATAATVGHKHRVVVSGATSTTAATTIPATTTTTIGLSAAVRTRLSHIPGDTWIFGVMEKSWSSWQSVRGTVVASNGPSPLQFAASRPGDYLWQWGDILGATIGDVHVDVTPDQRRVMVTLKPKPDPTTTTTVCGECSKIPTGEFETNNAAVNELIAPTSLLRQTIAPLATAVHVVGSATVAGRDTWQTEIDFPGANFRSPWIYWVDKQKGILLKTVASGVTKELTSVAFGQPMPGLPNPTIAAGFTIQSYLEPGRAFYETTLRRSLPLAEIVADLRAGQGSKINSPSGP